MRVILITLILCFTSLQLDAKKAGSLSDAVNQAKKEGRVLSARTINGRHEVKVLTNSGTVKIINKKAATSSSFGNNNQSPSEYYNKDGKSSQNLNNRSSRSRNSSSSKNRNGNSLAPSRFNSQRKSIENRQSKKQVKLFIK